MLVKRRPPRPEKKEHPTKRALIDTVVTMLDTMPVESVTCDAVLDTSGISRGSLYYHFEDFGDLIEHALLFRFSRFVDGTIAWLEQTVATAASRNVFRTACLDIARALHDPQGSQVRFDRTVPYAAAASSERFRTMLGAEQQRLTDGYTAFMVAAQERGWIAPDLDPHAVSVLWQAFALGAVVDDLAPNRAASSAWDTAVVALLDRVLTPA